MCVLKKSQFFDMFRVDFKLYKKVNKLISKSLSNYFSYIAAQ